MKRIQNFTLTIALAILTTAAFSQIKVVAPNGDVGIGTSTPTEKLEVEGNVFVRDGSIILENGPEITNFVLGSDNSRRMGFSTNLTSQTSSGFFSIFGDETGPGGQAARRGEFNMGGRYLVFRAGKAPGNFGNVALRIYEDNRMRVFSDETEKQGNSNWTIWSDKRLKNNVRDFQGGLKEVLEINPVWYQYNGKAHTKTGREFVGVIAQEFQEVAPYDVKELETEDDEGRIETYLGVNDSSVKYMLVNAIKEQQAMIEELTSKIESLESMIGEVDQTTINSVELTGYDAAVLGQNIPNPFEGETLIDYTIPTDASNASLRIYNMDGKVMKTVTLDHNGKGKLRVSTSDIPAGTYSYELVVDGRSIDIKKMVIAQ